MPSRNCLSSRLCRLLSTAILAGSLLLEGCQPGPGANEKSNKPSAASGQAPPREVVVTEVRFEVWPRTLRVQGSLLGEERAVVGTKIAGRVEAVEVDLGSLVRKGNVLVVLDRRELELRVRQAEAQLRQACAAIGLLPEQSEMEVRREQAAPVLLEKALLDEARAAMARTERLPTRQAMSETELERLTAQLKTAEARHQSALNAVGEQIALIGVRRAELLLAQQQLDEAQIVAPFDGIVEQRSVSPGEYVQAGQAVATVVRTDKLRFAAGVPESKAREIRLDQRVVIRRGDGLPPLETKVARISPMVVQANRALWIEADVPNDDLQLPAGLFAEAEIVVDPVAETLVVPAAAVTEFAGIEKVWIVREGQAAEQPVRTGRRDGQRIEILENLRAGDLIVSHADRGFAGAVVAVREPGASAQLDALPEESAE